MYHSGSRALQDRFDTRRLADRLDEKLVRDTIGADDRAFIEARDMFFLATADDDGRPNCSYKGGEPGFFAPTPRSAHRRAGSEVDDVGEAGVLSVRDASAPACRSAATPVIRQHVPQ